MASIRGDFILLDALMEMGCKQSLNLISFLLDNHLLAIRGQIRRSTCNQCDCSSPEVPWLSSAFSLTLPSPSALRGLLFTTRSSIYRARYRHNFKSKLGSARDDASCKLLFSKGIQSSIHRKGRWIYLVGAVHTGPTQKRPLDWRKTCRPAQQSGSYSGMYPNNPIRPKTPCNNRYHMGRGTRG